MRPLLSPRALVRCAGLRPRCRLRERTHRQPPRVGAAVGHQLASQPAHAAAGIRDRGGCQAAVRRARSLEIHESPRAGNASPQRPCDGTVDESRDGVTGGSCSVSHRPPERLCSRLTALRRPRISAISLCGLAIGTTVFEGGCSQSVRYGLQPADAILVASDLVTRCALQPMERRPRPRSVD